MIANAGRTREILEDLEAVCENLLALSDDEYCIGRSPRRDSGPSCPSEPHQPDRKDPRSGLSSYASRRTSWCPSNPIAVE
jgi:hypothetical protein